MDRRSELGDLIAASPWHMRVLQLVAGLDAPDCWVGAGALRDLVWDERFGTGFDPANVKDVDVVFFDAEDTRPEREEDLRTRLVAAAPEIPWEVVNQAAVHTWYEGRFGVRVPPLTSTLDGVATWPEYATCVAARLDDDGVALLAPHGLDDLLDGIWRRNPRRVTADEAAARLARKQPKKRWPRLRVVDEGGSAVG
jgi:hypothetical protein